MSIAPDLAAARTDRMVVPVVSRSGTWATTWPEGKRTPEAAAKAHSGPADLIDGIVIFGGRRRQTPW
jgi:hypothetical protein